MIIRNDVDLRVAAAVQESMYQFNASIAAWMDDLTTFASTVAEWAHWHAVDEGKA